MRCSKKYLVALVCDLLVASYRGKRCSSENITTQMVLDYERMLQAEERKFQLGESSLFLVNSRESKLIDGQLKAIEIQNKFFSTKAKLFNSLAVNPDI